MRGKKGGKKRKEENEGGGGGIYRTEFPLNRNIFTTRSTQTRVRHSPSTDA